MPHPEGIHLSIVIPAYNEEANIQATLRDIAGYLEGRPHPYEVIVVNDGSTDRTAEIASSASGIFKNFILLDNTVNRGKGYSVKKGVLAAKGEFILFMDADNSTRIDQVDKLMSVMKETGVVAAIASRRLRGSIIESRQPLRRIILGNIYIILSKLILGAGVSDYNCGFKLFRNNEAKMLFSRLTRDDWSFDSELIFLIFRFGLSIKEVPVAWQDKRTSKVKPWRDGIRSLVSLLKIRSHKY